MDKVVNELGGFAMALLGLAALALIISRSGNFAEAAGGFGAAVSSMIRAATLQNGA
jgi:hypothetical protein